MKYPHSLWRWRCMCCSSPFSQSRCILPNTRSSLQKPRRSVSAPFFRLCWDTVLSVPMQLHFKPDIIQTWEIGHPLQDPLAQGTLSYCLGSAWPPGWNPLCKAPPLLWRETLGNMQNIYLLWVQRITTKRCQKWNIFQDLYENIGAETFLSSSTLLLSFVHRTHISFQHTCSHGDQDIPD